MKKLTTNILTWENIQNQSSQTAYETKASWGMGGSKSRALNAATTLITGALGSQTDLQQA